MPKPKNRDVQDEAPRPSDRLPNIEQLRESQRKGGEPGGLDENRTGKLNQTQGHAVDIRE
jgi:hypothetical protein